LRHDLFVLAGGNVQDRACFIYQRSSDAAGANVDGECEIAAQGKPPGGKRQRLSDPQGTPFGPRIHALAVNLKGMQLFSYQRLSAALIDLFGLTVSEGALMNMFKRTKTAFEARRAEALWRRSAGRGSSPATKPERASKASTRFTGCSAARRRSSTRPFSLAPPKSCATSWPAIARPTHSLII
jgi:hypothetical protein